MAPKRKATESSQGQQTISSFFAKKREGSLIDLTANDSDDDLRQPAKKSKSAAVKSSFFVRDSASPEIYVVGSSSLISPSQPSREREGKEKATSSVRDATLKSTSKGKGKETVIARSTSTKQSDGNLSFREKLRRRDLSKREGEERFSKPLENPSDDHDMDMDEDRPSLTKIRGFAASNPLPWEKGPKKARKAAPLIGPAGLPCTPLEEAVIQFKKEYPDTVLLIEVGYKYCFFGDDAKIAGQVLGFFYGLDHNFLRTSCPVHNLKVNVQKLVAAGHKVGVVSQIETAALKKAGDNRNTLFDRKLTELYTPCTFVDDFDSQDSFGQVTHPLMSIAEETRGGSGPDDKVLIGFISIVPSTGDIVYDEFEDTLLRGELETRLTHTSPSELLLPSNLSAPTEKVLRHFAAHGTYGRVRIERSKYTLDYSTAFSYISELYEKQSDHFVAAITDLPKRVVVALALALKHLTAFGLSTTLLETNFFTKFMTRAHMLLNTNTIRNLEIYRNQTDFTEKGTLFSVLNRTTTIFGKRLLKSWVGRPLVDKTVLQKRVDAVEEARLGQSDNLTLLRGLLKGLPDLARGLCSIQYGRCAPKELAILLIAFNRVGATFKTFSDPSEVECSSPLWTDIVFALPALKIPMAEILASINLQRAREGNKAEMWTDPERFPALEDVQFAIMSVESELAEQLKKIRKLLKMPSLKYTTVKGDEFLIEVPKERASSAPATWVRLSSTAKVVRFHSPEIIQLLQEREQHKETRQLEADKAYKKFLQDIAQHYALFRDAVNKLATADCLMSLATISLHGNYCKPQFVEGSSLSIVGGRHPIIEMLDSGEPFIPNTIKCGGDYPRNLVISGPNMGGKTSIVKLTALLVIMAQIGSYVPAENMTSGIHDAILTRMGASDDLAAGRSTFMVEIAETCEIIKSATPNSLVILDELGRGTSTFDGMAIAGAVLEYLARDLRSKTMFITHYPTLARELEARYPREIANQHMGFTEDIRIDGRREIYFLYKLTGGISGGSFGIECARLAGVPEPILRKASSQAEMMQELMEERTKKANAKIASQLLRQCVQMDRLDIKMLNELRTQMKIMGL